MDCNNIIEEFRAKTDVCFHKIEGLSAREIEAIARVHILDVLDRVDADVEIVDVVVAGSRCRGLEKAGSDLDIVFEFKSESWREDDLFNLLHNEDFFIGDVPVDLNPISETEISGNLEEYLPKAEAYLATFKRKDQEMGGLSNLLERAFENKGNKNRYSDGEWSIGFDERTWDTRFELYHNDVPVMEVNTLDKELKLSTGSEYPIEKLIPEVEKALPEYRFDIRVAIMIPVDFNGHWTQEVENAEFDDVIDECRFEDVSDGYGYDVAVFTVPRLSDVKNIVLIDEDNEKFSVEEWDMRENEGKVEVSPTVYSPVQEFHGPAQKAPMSLNERIREAEKKAEELLGASGAVATEKGTKDISRD